MKVEQFMHANQFHLYGEGKDILQSYNSKVVEITRYPGCYKTITLGRDWDYSTTTSKHVYEFLDEYAGLYCGASNKRDYIRKLIKEYEEDKNKFLDKHNFVIVYDENMI